MGTLVLILPSGGASHIKSWWLAELTANDIYHLVIQVDEERDVQTGYLPAALGWQRGDPLALRTALDALLPNLGDRLMHLVVGLLKAMSCHRAILITSWYLSVLPLHAATYVPIADEPATAPNGRRYACDDVSFTYAPSGLTYLNAHQAAARQTVSDQANRIFIAGNPQLSRPEELWTFETPGYLRYAEWEARRVADVSVQRTPPLIVDLALNDQATQKRVVDGLGDADIVHLAAHATFNAAEPQQSALLVAFRSRLLLRDLLDPRLVSLARLRLVILSACQSALGDFDRQSEEAVGLFGALLAGGVPGVIGTLWSVNDLATAALMESFAQRYLLQGEAPDVALRAAARELRGIFSGTADPAEQASRTSAEQIPSVDAEAPYKLTSAARRWGELVEANPQGAGRARFLSEKELETAGENVQAFRTIPRDHPIYWAAFVFHGASLPLGGNGD